MKYVAILALMILTGCAANSRPPQDNSDFNAAYFYLRAKPGYCKITEYDGDKMITRECDLEDWEKFMEPTR